MSYSVGKQGLKGFDIPKWNGFLISEDIFLLLTMIHFRRAEWGVYGGKIGFLNSYKRGKT